MNNNKYYWRNFFIFFRFYFSLSYQFYFYNSDDSRFGLLTKASSSCSFFLRPEFCWKRVRIARKRLNKSLLSRSEARMRDARLNEDDFISVVVRWRSKNTIMVERVAYSTFFKMYKSIYTFILKYLFSVFSKLKNIIIYWLKWNTSNIYYLSILKICIIYITYVTFKSWF